MICPYCKIDIEEDSYFCDQCGQEILICPKCSKPGKGKMCIHDGTALESARKMGEVISYGTGQSPLIETPSISTSATELHLINKNLGLDLKVVGDEIIGRTVGRFAEIFSRFPQVSRQHCQIKFDPKQGWTVTDLGSANGTKYNNLPLKQGELQPLADKSFLLIANIEFYVEIQAQVHKTVRLS